MDNDGKKIKDWARKCGYGGPIPKDMSSFYNESTLHIWNNIVTKVKPRVEVEEVQRKLVVHRLKSGMPLNEAMKKEFLIYNKLKTVTDFKEDTLNRITEKEAVLKKIQKRIKESEFELEKIKASNEAIKMKSFLFQEKTNSYADVTEKLKSNIDFVENNKFLNNPVNMKEQTQISTVLKDYFGRDIKDISNAENEIILKILRNHKNSVFNEVHTIEEKLLQNLWNNIEICENIVSTSCSADKIKYNNEKFSLYAKCLQYDLDAKILDKTIVKLQISLQNYKEMHRSKLLSQKYNCAQIDHMIKKIEAGAKFAGLDASNIHLRKKINDLNQKLILLNQNSTNLDNIKSELQVINNSMASSLKNISIKSKEVAEKQLIIERAKINLKTALETLLCINLIFLAPMMENVLSSEVDVFRDYPIEYNKGGTNNTTPLSKQPLSNLLIEIPQVNPQQTSWELVTTIHDDLRYLKQLISASERSPYVLTPQVNPGFLTTYSPQFKDNAEVVERLVNDLKGATERICLSEMMLGQKQFDQMLADWLDVKMGAFLLQHRLFEGKCYMHYEKEFSTFYNML